MSVSAIKPHICLLRRLVVVALILLLVPAECRAEGPVLARLSFWVPPERMGEFETAYRERVIPILARHGLAEASERGRPTPDNVFRRLFRVPSVEDLLEKQEKLQADPEWRDLLGELGKTFGTSESSGQLRYYLAFYAMPAKEMEKVPARLGKTVMAGPGRGHWRHYDATDGIPGSGPWTLLQDRRGYIWVGTLGGGVCRYDGETFTTFTEEDGLAAHSALASMEDRDGNLWFGTRGGGVSRYDGETFTNFNAENGLIGNNVWSVFQDRDGNFWFGALGDGLSRYDGKTFTNFTWENGLVHAINRQGLRNSEIFDIFQDRDGYLWFGGVGGVSRYDGREFVTFSQEDGLASKNLTAIHQDRDSNLWFGTWDSGVSRYDGKAFKTFSIENGLAGNHVWSITEDRDGNLWFGTRGSGVSRYDGKQFTNFNAEDGLLTSGVAVQSGMLHDREGLHWFAGGSGISCYDETFVAFTLEDGPANSYVRHIYEARDGTLWFAMGKHLVHYDGERFTAIDGLGENIVTTIYEDRDNRLWFGLGGGRGLICGSSLFHVGSFMSSLPAMR